MQLCMAMHALGCAEVDSCVTGWRGSGELGLGPRASPSPGSAPDAAQRFTALLCPGDNRVRCLRTTSPTTPHTATKQTPSLDCAKTGYQGSQTLRSW